MMGIEVSKEMETWPAVLTVGELARFWRVHPDTIHRAIKKGALRALRIPGGGEARRITRITREDAIAYGRPE